ncbi:hypothetical protein BDZ85DRAFT_262742 [Elsinoe ampelina]|uniref:JmjC domain-containing protein n=1 Tax=Elsinoe ampelina TaxID=302913 RepID=A0A6A6GB57_9PEZI|nr:hypothetical protein BDZ85DRAFT_262742 [Elsinoe ampelina]
MRFIRCSINTGSLPRRQSKFQSTLASTRTLTVQPVTRLTSGDVDHFRDTAFKPQIPALLPEGYYRSLPAISKWVTCPKNSHERPALIRSYLEQFASTSVPLELTIGGDFARVDQPLSIFLDASESITTSEARVYLAQASLSDLPEDLRRDLPTPDLVLKAGKGDVYDTSIWLGLAPTYTPLHRDPNPNLFVQLAGTKRVRLFSPDVGRAIFGHVQAEIGGHASATMRGEEMMQGEERRALEDAVWGEAEHRPWLQDALECEVGAGDGLFIPKGWWHSIKGVGEGMTGSSMWLLSAWFGVLYRPNDPLNGVLQYQVRDLIARYESADQCSTVHGNDEDLLYKSVRLSQSQHTTILTVHVLLKRHAGYS